MWQISNFTGAFFTNHLKKQPEVKKYLDNDKVVTE